jgi:phage regulator Rha-like protein
MSLVIVDHQRNDLLVDSRLIAEQPGTPRHISLIELIEDHRSDFEEFGQLRFETEVGERKQGGGNPVRYALLNEYQAVLLFTYMRNTATVRAFKVRLVKELERLRKRLNRAERERASLEWQQARDSGKLVRKAETDVVREFVEYATEQGSRNARMYYQNLTKATYKALFLLEHATKWKGVRELLDGPQLTLVTTAEQIVQQALKDGMRQGLPYKDIYKLAVDRLTGLSLLLPPASPPALAALPAA